MKKLLALLLALLMMFSLVACGGETNGDNKGDSSTPSIITGVDDVDDDFDDDSSEEKEPLVLEGKDEYVVAVRANSDLTLSHIKDIKGLKVAYGRGADSDKMAYYFEAECFEYGGENDAFSALLGGNVDCVIVKKMSAETQVKAGNAKIILDPIVID